MQGGSCFTAQISSPASQSQLKQEAFCALHGSVSQNSFSTVSIYAQIKHIKTLVITFSTPLLLVTVLLVIQASVQQLVYSVAQSKPFCNPIE